MTVFPIRSHVRALRPVVHGGAAQLRARGLDPARIDDFSATLLPLSPPPPVRAAIAAVDPRSYPDPASTRLRKLLARRHGVDPAQVLCAGGSVALIRAIARTCLGPGDRALIVGPTFGEYAAGVRAAGGSVEEVCTDRVDRVLGAIDRHRPALVFLCNPNNPTGHRWTADQVAAIAARAPLVVDEAYMGFLQPCPAPVMGPGRLVLRSLTKDHAMAGLRVGYALGDPDLLAAVAHQLDPWGLGSVAEAAAVAALSHPAPYRDAIAALWRERDRLAEAIAGLGLPVDVRAAPFFLVEVGDAAAASARLLESGLLVRDCSSFGLPHHIRISPQTPAAGDRLVAALASLPLPCTNREQP
ncbi:MAG: histidinol-phosphate aminotransferase family protein [Deltaproteobacteria bacterium]|nr:MAG: histidinol-phosphate aminotransferase family protein [Deltaproteobacteria bacterium]